MASASEDEGAVAGKSGKKSGGKRRRGAGGGVEQEVAAGGVTEESWGALEGHSQFVTSIDWLDSNRLVSGSWDHSVCRSPHLCIPAS
jgi:hypothetical protein